MVTAARVCRGSAILLYLGLGAQGVWGAFGQLDDSETFGQQAQTALQFAFGLLGLGAGAFLVVRRSVPAAIEWGWVLALGLAGGIAAVAWGEAPVLIGLVAGVCTGLVALAVVWLARRGRSG